MFPSPRLCLGTLALAAALIVAGSWSSAARSTVLASMQRPTGGSETAQSMRSHFDEATRIHEAVVRGDLDAAREPARRLAAYDADAWPMEGRRYVAGLALAAARVSTAADVSAAAAATASMLVSCGDCHRATGRRPAPAAVSQRFEVGGVVGHMIEHEAAVDALYRGLVIPSLQDWRDGARRLQMAPLRSGSLPRDPNLTGRVLASEKRVHDLAARAATADNQTRRATAYAELITQCAGCHALHPTVWGPRSR